MKKERRLIIRGKEHEWSVAVQLTDDALDAMREDGFEIDTLVYSMPAWVMESGLATPWMFFSDIFNFKNPWKD